jgi:hypothetical protein
MVRSFSAFVRSSFLRGMDVVRNISVRPMLRKFHFQFNSETHDFEIQFGGQIHINPLKTKCVCFI